MEYKYRIGELESNRYLGFILTIWNINDQEAVFLNFIFDFKLTIWNINQTLKSYYDYDNKALN